MGVRVECADGASVSARNGRIEVVKLLVAAGANRVIWTPTTSTPAAAKATPITNIASISAGSLTMARRAVRLAV